MGGGLATLAQTGTPPSASTPVTSQEAVTSPGFSPRSYSEHQRRMMKEPPFGEADDKGPPRSSGRFPYKGLRMPKADADAADKSEDEEEEEEVDDEEPGHG